jgi:RimJ/RimL family protein N-acetyltransferase
VGDAVAFDLQPNLKGELLELRPVTPRDWDDLFAVASDPLIWEQHPESDRYKEEVFEIFFREALESGGAFVVIDRATQQIIGSTRFYGYDPEKSEIEIGWTFLAREYWGGQYNCEMKSLMLNHAFKFVKERGVPYRRKEHPVAKGDRENWRDQKWNGHKGVWKASARSQREIRDQEAVD